MSALLNWGTAQESIWRTRGRHSDRIAPLLTIYLSQDNDEHPFRRNFRRHILQFKPTAGPSHPMTTKILRPRTLASSDADYHYTARDFFGARLSPCEAAASIKLGGSLPQQVIVEP